MSYDLDWWLREVGRYPLLSQHEQKRLGAIIQAWRQFEPQDQIPPRIARAGVLARDAMIRANLRLAVFYVSKRCRRLVKDSHLEDLIQAANMGLIEAVERYDPSRPTRFSTMAYWWIRQSVNRWADQHSRSIRIPGIHNRHLARIAAFRQDYESQHGRQPTHEELAAAAGISMQLLAQVLENGRPIDSLDFRLADDTATSMLEIVPGGQALSSLEMDNARCESAAKLRSALERLPARDARLIRLAWGLDGVQVPHEELAQEYDMPLRSLRARLHKLCERMRVLLTQ